LITSPLIIDVGLVPTGICLQVHT